MPCDKWQQSIPAVKGECMAIVLWYLNIVCTEAGSMFVSCLWEPVWIIDKITKNRIHFLRLLVASSKHKILGDFYLLKSFANFMTQEVSWFFWAGETWCSATETPGTPRFDPYFRGGFNFIYNLLYWFSIYLKIRGFRV